ncbi:hypothetical protein EYC58_03210 [Candidatus Saccharibacteria bacterium]|nr:MAG: hypothetical protein EYC58_03210 [Candidatus Saccharibacteria bacterium]
MFQLDDKFLQDIGLGDLPEDQRKAFLQHIYDELELRVGTKLSEGMSEQQMSEFESFVDRAEDKVRAWFAANMPDYASRPDYQQFASSAPEGTDEVAILSEYASLKWLEMNRPDYRQIVAQELESLKQEIMSQKDAILGRDHAA